MCCLANNPPRLSGNSTFYVHINVSSTYSFYVFDPNDTYTVSLHGTLPPSSDYSFSNDDSAYRFSWTPTSFSNVRLLFVANDSIGAVSLLHPEVRLCGCALNLNATCVDSSEDGGEDRFITQDCRCGSGKNASSSSSGSHDWIVSCTAIQDGRADFVIRISTDVRTLIALKAWNVLIVLHHLPVQYVDPVRMAL